MQTFLRLALTPCAQQDHLGGFELRYVYKQKRSAYTQFDVLQATQAA